MKRTANTYVFDLASHATGDNYSINATAWSEAEARAAIVAYYGQNFTVCDKAKEISEPHKYYAELNCI